MENHTTVFLEMKVFEASDEGTRVTQRLDKEPALHTSWERSNDGKFLFYTGGPIAFVQQMEKHDSFYIEWTPFDAPTYAARFDISGLTNAVKDLANACHWAPAPAAKKAAASKPAVPQVPNSPEFQAILDQMKAGQS
jgi:hypothetical protein